MAQKVGRTSIVSPGRIARTRPPGRDQSGLRWQALEYDLQDLADKATVNQLIQVIKDTGGGSGGPPPTIIYALTMPPEFSVSGSPGVNGGTFGVLWVPAPANLGLWGPASGSAAAPTIRRQVNDDLPFRSQIKIEPTAFGSSVDIDASVASQFSLVATSDFTLNAPTGMLDGQKITIRITQDGTGSRVMTYDPLYRFSTYLTPAFCTLSTTPGASDYLGCEFNADAGAFDIIAYVPGVGP